MEILDLRHFNSSDLRPLLEEETEVWSRLLAWDYTPSADMILRYVDARILPGYAAVERGKLYGYSFFVYEGTKGVVGDLYAASGRARNGEHLVEERLATHVVETLQQSPGVNRIEAQLLVHASGAVAEPFLRDGFQRYPRLFMVLQLREGRPATASLQAVSQQFDIRRWTEQDYNSAAALITTCYRGHIDSDINDQYRSVPGALRFLNNIVRFPGCGVFDPSSSYVAVERSARIPVGLILCSRVKNDVGHVTQVCVLPEYRGKKLGQALLEATSSDLRRRKFCLLTLTVTEANKGAVDLYKYLGFTIERVFDAFVWDG